jgi:hypothetical protein
MTKTKLKAVDAPETSQSNKDRESVRYLAACIYPGDGFAPNF